MKNRIRGIPLVLLLVAVLMAACGTIKNTMSEQTSSLEQSSSSTQLEAQAAAVHDVQLHTQEQMQAEQTTTLREYAEPVPEEQTDMTIPMQNLLDLPDGAKYSAQNGRASVEAEKHGDKIVVRGRCDSIARRHLLRELRIPTKLDDRFVICPYLRVASVSSEGRLARRSRDPAHSEFQEDRKTAFYVVLVAARRGSGGRGHIGMADEKEPAEIDYQTY